MLLKPKVDACQVNLYVTEFGNERVAKSLACSLENVEPVPQWISNPVLSSIEVTWNTEHDDFSFQLPSVNYISNASVGIIRSWFQIRSNGEKQVFRCLFAYR